MKVNNGIRSQIELWLLLVFLVSLGWSFGLILTSALSSFLGIEPGSIINIFIAGILGGIFISFLSLFIILESIRSVGVWLLTTTLGWLSGLLERYTACKLWQVGAVGSSVVLLAG